jgi:RNA polymerase sigma-70 factor (ECF subfamily)
MTIELVRNHGGSAPATEPEVCRRYAERIRAYGLRHLRRSADAQDLVQQVLLAVLEALRQGKVEDESRLDAYVLGTCRNMVLSMRRGDLRAQRVAEQASAVLPEGYEPPWVEVDPRRLEGCLRALEPRHRAVIVATFVEDRDADEIGRSLELTAGNVRVIRHRALASLLACVERGGP